MTTTCFCPVCLRSKEDCEKEDEKLIIPFNEKNRYQKLFCADDHVSDRWIKAYRYSIGSYNTKNRCFYHDTLLSPRQIADIHNKLPLCVWEGDYGRLWCSQNGINRENIDRLPLPKSTKKKLEDFFETQIHEFLSNLPTQYRRL